MTIATLIEKLQEDISFLGYNETEREIIKHIKCAIALLKENEPKTGKWILDDEDANSWECSECGGLLIINDGTPHENDWHFCPYCGAKLDKQVVKWDD